MIRLSILAVAIGLGIAGCAGVQGDMQQADASDVESALRSAGFVLIPADTPQRIEAMRTLPPLVFSQVMREGRSYFVYADPRSCMCLWVGTLEQLHRYGELASEEALMGMQGELGIVEMQADLWDPDWAGIDD